MKKKKEFYKNEEDEDFLDFVVGRTVLILTIIFFLSTYPLIEANSKSDSVHWGNIFILWVIGVEFFIRNSNKVDSDATLCLCILFLVALCIFLVALFKGGL